MIRSLAVVVSLALAACSGSTPKSDGGQKCTGQAYDPCNTEHDCNNGECRPFADEGIMVCTQACGSGGSACPQQDGHDVACNSGLCEPTVANSCKIQ
jgi:hypothetical protein